MVKSKYEFPEMFRKLGFTKGAEIGVAEGVFSEALCKGIPDLELYCIDYWTPYRGNRWGGSRERNTHHLEAATERLAKYNTHIIRELSMDAVKRFKERELDFVYIDANHAFDYVMQDLIEWTKRVKIGGIVAGDDYYPFNCGKQNYGGVIEAVNAYTKAHGIEFELTDPYTTKVKDRHCQEQANYYWMRVFK